MIRAQPTSEAGFNLIEVMVAIAIFAVGLLSLAALQMATLKFNANAQYVTQSTFLANQMVGYLWGTVNSTSDTTSLQQFDGASVTANGVSAPNGTAATLSTLSTWRDAVLGLSGGGALPDVGLPNGSATVAVQSCLPCSTAPTGSAFPCNVAITLRWAGRYGPSAYTISSAIGFPSCDQ